MLLNDFYTCHEPVANAHEFGCRIGFNEGHSIFKGHFPGNPIVPGVCMMEMVKELLQEQVKTPLLLRTSGNIKFLQLIKPDFTPHIKIEWKDAANEGYAVKAQLYGDGIVYFKLDGVYERA